MGWLYFLGYVRISWGGSQDYYLNKYLPSWTKLEKEVNVILCLWEINELDDILVMNQLPCFYLIFQCIYEILLRQWFVFWKVYLLYQVLFLYHFASNDFIRFSIDGKVSLREATFSKFFIFDRVATINYFEGVAVLHGFFYFLCLTFHLMIQIII